MNQSNSSSGNDSAFPALQSIQRLAISQSGFVFDPESGHNFTVNETGLELLRRLQTEQDLGKLLDALTQDYDASRLDIERDVLEFAALLRDYIGE